MTATGGKELVIRISADFDADNSELSKALDAVTVDAKQMADAFASAASSSSKALDTIGLGATNQVGRMTKLHSAFQGFTGTLGSGLGAIGKFANALGPWNQALELGGKAVKFVGDGLDAYAKTSKEAAAEVEKLTKEFTGMKDAAMAAFGAVAVEALKPIPSIKELERNLRGLEGVFEDAFKAYDSKGATAARGIEAVFGGGAFKGIASQFRDDWYTGPSPDDLLDKVGKRIEKIKDAQKTAKEETKAWVKAMQELESARFGGMLLNAPGKGAAGIGGLAGSLSARAGAAADKTVGKYRDDATASSDPRSLQEGMQADWGLDIKAATAGRRGYGGRSKEEFGLTTDQLEKRQDQEKFLEKTFGKIEEFDAYATAFGTLNTAVQGAMQAWIGGSMSLGTAIKKGLGDSLAGVASQMGVESIKHGAYAIGSLAFGDVSGAGRHGAAAAMFGAGSLAAAAAAKKLGGSAAADVASAQSAGGGATGTSTAPGGTSSSSGGAGAPASSGVTKETIIVAYTDAFAQGSERMRVRTAEQIVGRVTGGQGWSND